MDIWHWLEASLVALGALALSAACIRFRIGKGEYLCSDCRYNSAGLCDKADRPKATACTSYRAGVVESADEEVKEPD